MVLATSQQEFSDADFRIVDNGDQSKKLAFEVSGIATATTRTWTVPDADVTISSAWATFFGTSSSANLRAVLTDETGTGAAVFADSPSLTTKVNLNSGFVLDFASGDVTITHSSNALTFAGAASGYFFDNTVFGNGVNLGSSGVKWASGFLSGTLFLKSFSATGATLGAQYDGTWSLSATGTGTNFMAAWYNANGLIGNINTNGSTTNYVTSSDQELKIDDGPIDLATAVATLRLIQIHNFRWKRSGEAAIGVFAQELHKVYPAAVTVGGWYERSMTTELLDEQNGQMVLDDYGNPVMHELLYLEYIPWGVDYSKLMPLVIAAMQNLDERLSALEAA